MRYKLHPEHQVLVVGGLTMQHHAHKEDVSIELKLKWPRPMRFSFSTQLLPNRRGLPDFYRRFR
jgi:hypothetical protein